MSTHPSFMDPLEVVARYHQQTKHRFSRFARAPDCMDWANQPDPYRRYEGSPLVSLPRLTLDDTPLSPRYEDLYLGADAAGAGLDAHTISRFFEWSLAISAWKQAGEVRWGLRVNPSSGNLHPTEAYLLIDEIPGLGQPAGLYHYAVREHALELRAEMPHGGLGLLRQGFPPGAFFLGLASVHWRETWKYGERAFRYCQHDVGHAIGSVRIAARSLGWRMLLLDGAADDTVAALLGLDRAQDFAGAEREHPDGLAVVWPAAPSGHPVPDREIAVPLSISPDTVRRLPPRVWHGKANRLSPDRPREWDILRQVEAASWKPSTVPDVVEAHGGRATDPPDVGIAVPSEPRPGPSASQVIRQRRSALAFDGTTSVPARRFFALLARLMPRLDPATGRRAMPWDVLPWAPAVHLALFVHQVDDVAPGLYCLVRHEAAADALRHATYRQFEWRRPPGCPNDLPLYLLQQADTRSLAVELCCRQAIAGDGAFSAGMIAEFEPRLRLAGPWFYRRLFWETGLIGQVLYLEAEAIGLRGTGIGCFFDDPVHQVLGFSDAAFQSLYHFAVGGPMADPRLTHDMA